MVDPSSIGAGKPPIKCGFNFFENAIELTPPGYGAYREVDISAHVPGYATGAIVEVTNTDGWNKKAYLRKKGSSDDGYAADRSRFAGNSCVFYIVGIDGDLIFEAKVQDSTVKLYLVGYTDDYVTLFTNRIDKSTGTTGSWVNTDVSGDGVPATATGVILQIVGQDSTPKNYCVRKPGQASVENDKDTLGYTTHMTTCGVDANRVFQQWVETTNVKVYLLGYTKSPVIFLADTYTPAQFTDNTWREANLSSQVPADACGVLLWVRVTGTQRYVSQRKPGSTDDRSANHLIISYCRKAYFCGVDENRVLQYKSSGGGGIFKVIGYSKEA